MLDFEVRVNSCAFLSLYRKLLWNPLPSLCLLIRQNCFKFSPTTNFVGLCIGVARRAKGPSPPKFLENITILCFESRFYKQNSIIRLKSNILPPQIFGLATPLGLCPLRCQQAVPAHSFIIKRCMICKDNPRDFMDWLSHVGLLRICNIAQAPDACLLRERCSMARVCFQEMRDYYFCVQTLQSCLH